MTAPAGAGASGPGSPSGGNGPSHEAGTVKHVNSGAFSAFGRPASGSASPAFVQAVMHGLFNTASRGALPDSPARAVPAVPGKPGTGSNSASTDGISCVCASGTSGISPAGTAIGLSAGTGPATGSPVRASVDSGSGALLALAAVLLLAGAAMAGSRSRFARQ
jgi:hypothetical protein